MRLKIREAIGRAEMRGKVIKRSELGAYLFPQSGEASRCNRMTALINGKLATIHPETVIRLCEFLDCSADFLFGLENAEV
jgi:hypothetical protein